MFIDTNRIQDIVDAGVHLTRDEIIQELRILLEEEAERFDKMAEEYEQREEEAARLNQMVEEYEDMEYGRFEREDAMYEKEIAKLRDWPGAV
tara:strand:- start:217 stop:492 length:276 start_codon:yes stop_codon:yes gene_type:complete